LEELALEVGDVLGEQRSDALDRLSHLTQADRRRGERDVVRGELRLVPAGAEAAGDPPTAQVIERCHRIREHGRVPIADAVDETAAAHT
jgi:hypothetical protein